MAGGPLKGPERWAPASAFATLGSHGFVSGHDFIRAKTATRTFRAFSVCGKLYRQPPCVKKTS